MGSRPVAIMDAEKPWGSCAIAEANMMPGIFSTHAREDAPSSKRARSILSMYPMAVLVDGVALRMVGGG